MPTMINPVHRDETESKGFLPLHNYFTTLAAACRFEKTSQNPNKGQRLVLVQDPAAANLKDRSLYFKNQNESQEKERPTCTVSQYCAVPPACPRRAMSGDLSQASSINGGIDMEEEGDLLSPLQGFPKRRFNAQSGSDSKKGYSLPPSCPVRQISGVGEISTSNDQKRNILPPNCPVHQESLDNGLPSSDDINDMLLPMCPVDQTCSTRSLNFVLKQAERVNMTNFKKRPSSHSDGENKVDMKNLCQSFIFGERLASDSLLDD